MQNEKQNNFDIVYEKLYACLVDVWVRVIGFDVIMNCK